MPAAGQFCSVAGSLDLLGGRWTLLVIRELLCGSRRFNDIRRGIPRISRTVLSERLQALAFARVVARIEGQSGPEYELTASGYELGELVGGLGTWGQRWLPRNAAVEDLDLGPLILDMSRRVDFDVVGPCPRSRTPACRSLQPAADERQDHAAARHAFSAATRGFHRDRHDDE